MSDLDSAGLIILTGLMKWWLVELIIWYFGYTIGLLGRATEESLPPFIEIMTDLALH